MVMLIDGFVECLLGGCWLDLMYRGGWIAWVTCGYLGRILG